METTKAMKCGPWEWRDHGKSWIIVGERFCSAATDHGEDSNCVAAAGVSRRRAARGRVRNQLKVPTA